MIDVDNKSLAKILNLFIVHNIIVRNVLKYLKSRWLLLEFCYTFMCVYIYIRNHENSVPYWFSPQWLCGNSCTWATVHHVPKCMSCHKAIVVITGRVHCFYDCIYITTILLLWDLSTVSVVDHLWPLIYRL